jgi:hypothetical protein
MPILAAELVSLILQVPRYVLNTFLSCFDQPRVFPYTREFRTCWMQRGSLI